MSSWVCVYDLSTFIPSVKFRVDHRIIRHHTTNVRVANIHTLIGLRCRAVGGLWRPDQTAAPSTLLFRRIWCGSSTPTTAFEKQHPLGGAGITEELVAGWGTVEAFGTVRIGHILWELIAEHSSGKQCSNKAELQRAQQWQTIEWKHGTPM
jgi:hypothetical protein